MYVKFDFTTLDLAPIVHTIIALGHVFLTELFYFFTFFLLLFVMIQSASIKYYTLQNNQHHPAHVALSI